MAAIRPNAGNPTVGGVVGGILGIRDEIRDPTPGNPVGPIGRGVCNVLSSVGYDGIPLNNRTGPGFVCEPYWDDQGFDPPANDVPFQGGQCSGTTYRAEFNYQTTLTGASSLTRNLTGPVTQYKAEFVRSVDANRDEWRFITEDANGLEDRATNSFIEKGTTPTTSPLVAISGPDNCGDPPAETGPGTTNPGVPYGDPRPIPEFPGTTIIVNAPITFNTGNGPDFYIPITIGDDDGNPVGPPIFWTPDGIPPELPPPPPPPVEPGDPQEPSDPSGDVPDDIPPDDEDDGIETIGYEWTLTGLPVNLSQVPGTSPAVLTTPYGNVQLRYEDSTGATRYSDNLPIRVVSGSIVRQDPRLTVKGVLYSRRPDIGGIRLVPLRARRV